MSVLRTVKALQKGLVGGIVTPLKERSLFLVEGKDTYKFLNGLVTLEIVNDGETSCKYGAFLNVKGNRVQISLPPHPSPRPQNLLHFKLPNPATFLFILQLIASIWLSFLRKSCLRCAYVPSTHGA